MKKLLLMLACLLLRAGMAQVPPAATDAAYPEGLQFGAAAALNMYGPLHVTNANVALPLGVAYTKYISRADARRRTPRLGLRLPLETTINRRLDDALYLPYTVMQPGVVSFVPSLFLDASPNAALHLFAQAGAGLRYYPLQNTNTSKDRLDGFDQRLLLLGGGLVYRLRPTPGPSSHLRLGLDYRRHWHDFSTRSEQYYRALTGFGTRFESLHGYGQANWRLTDGLELLTAVHWYGRPAREPAVKYYDVRLGLSVAPGEMSVGLNKRIERHQKRLQALLEQQQERKRLQALREQQQKQQQSTDQAPAGAPKKSVKP